MERSSKSANAFVTLIAICGLGLLGYGGMDYRPENSFRFVLLLIVAILASRMKLRLPRLTGNMSLDVPFILVGVAELGLFQALVIACASTLAQCYKRPIHTIKASHVAFNFGNMAVATGIAYFAFHYGVRPGVMIDAVLRLAIAAGVFFVANTTPVSAIIALTEGRNISKIWYEIFLWSFPSFVLSAGMASIITSVNRQAGMPVLLVCIPVLFGVYHCYKLYFKAPLTVPQEQERAVAASAD